MAAGGIVFETLMGLNFWTGAIIVTLQPASIPSLLAWAVTRSTPTCWAVT
jgi:hypothetical protein